MTSAKKVKLSSETEAKPGISRADFGGFIKQKRQEAGFSEKHVCEYLGASLQALRAYEAGDKAVPLNVIYALSNCLDISPSVITQMLAKNPVRKNTASKRI